MTLTRRCPLTVLFALFFAVFAITPIAGRAADAVRITAATNITMRESPNATAPVLAYLPLGTEVIEAAPMGMDKTWLLVRLPDNRQGWVLANLTRPLEPTRRWTTIERIVTERLGRQGDSFAATVEIASFIERVSGAIPDSEMAARFDLYRLRALNAALSQVGKGQTEPYVTWLGSYTNLIVYDEPARRWMLLNPAVWKIHDLHANTAAADDVAWLATSVGLPGECRGSLTCYVQAMNRLNGEYLRKHPLGQHSGEAVDAVKATADRLTSTSGTRLLYSFDRTRECSSLTGTLDELRAAVTPSSAPAKDAALQSLSSLRSLCK